MENPRIRVKKESEKRNKTTPAKQTSAEHSLVNKS